MGMGHALGIGPYQALSALFVPAPHGLGPGLGLKGKSLRLNAEERKDHTPALHEYTYRSACDGYAAGRRRTGCRNPVTGCAPWPGSATGFANSVAVWPGEKTQSQILQHRARKESQNREIA